LLATTNIKEEVVTMLTNRRFTLDIVNIMVKFGKLYKHDLGRNF